MASPRIILIYIYYDTSGEYTSGNEIDVRNGLEKHRLQWINNNHDIVKLNSFSSEYSVSQCSEHLNFKNRSLPMKADNGKNISQMHYAKKGIITPEMGSVANCLNQINSL